MLPSKHLKPGKRLFSSERQGLEVFSLMQKHAWEMLGKLVSKLCTHEHATEQVECDETESFPRRLAQTPFQALRARW